MSGAVRLVVARALLLSGLGVGMLILMLGYYAPFWIGAPFLPALSAPNQQAEMVHVAHATLSFLALAIAFPLFRADAEPAR